MRCPYCWWEEGLTDLREQPGGGYGYECPRCFCIFILVRKGVDHEPIPREGPSRTR